MSQLLDDPSRRTPNPPGPVSEAEPRGREDAQRRDDKRRAEQEGSRGGEERRRRRRLVAFAFSAAIWGPLLAGTGYFLVVGGADATLITMAVFIGLAALMTADHFAGEL